MTVLGIMGQTEAEQEKSDTKKSSMKAQAVNHAALGGGLSIGLAVVLGAFEVLKSNPKDAFPLLMAWGPKAVGSIVVIYVVYDILKIVLNLVSRLVRSVEKTAVAMQRLADKDDRSVQEMQTLTSYTAQQSEKAYQKMAEISETFSTATSQLTSAMGAMSARIDALTAGLKRDA